MCSTAKTASGLVAYYNFDNGIPNGNNTSTTTFPDLTGNGYNGTLHSFALTGTSSNFVNNGGGVVVVSTSSVLINTGSTTTLTASGVATYTWSTGSNHDTTIVKPISSTIYTVNGTNPIGCASSTTDTVFVKGAALNFNGSNNTVNLGTGLNATLSASNKITVEAWVNPSNTTYLGCIVGNYNTAGGSGMQFLLRRDNTKYTFWVDPGTGFVNVTSSATVTTGSWTHVAGTWDGTTMTIYVNGILSGTTSVSGTSLTSSPNPIWLGGNTAGTPEMFTGSIDEVRIWNRALCQGEIQNNMNGELHLPQTNLQAYYKFNQGLAGVNNASVTSLADSSGNAHNGTLTNFTLSGSTSNWTAPGGVTTGSYAATFTNPVISVSGGGIVVCSGTTTTLTATGSTLDTYTWVNANSTTATAVITPTTSTTYSVSGTKLGCPSNTAVTTVTVNPLPTITVNSPTLCAGATATLTANSGTATSYSWNTSATTASITASPTVTTNYTVTGTDANNCKAAATSTVTVNALPTVTSTSATICAGATGAITAGGASTYTWSTGTTGPGLSQSPGSTTHYTVTGSSAANCTNTAVGVINVNPLPSLTITATSPTVCVGHPDTLKAMGATFYTWSANAGSAHTPSVVVTPTVNTTYTVTGVDANGCSNVTSYTVTPSGCTTGIENYHTGTTGIILYPNPNNGNFTVESDKELGNIEVYDVLNRLVYSSSTSQTKLRIPLENSKAGVYYVRVLNTMMKVIKEL